MPSFSRRTFLGLIPGPLTSAQSPPRRQPYHVVVAGGHPGDPEYGCGGTIARYTNSGTEVTLLYLNRGEKTCPPSVDDPGSSVRVPEASKACEILKARPVFVGQCDGHAIVDPPHYDEFRALLAAEKPDLLFTHWPVDSHPDHRAISSLCYDAWVGIRTRRVAPDVGSQPWVKMRKSFAFYFYEVSNGEDTQVFAPTDYVDISATEAIKKAACYAHASQAPDKFYALQSSVSRFRGIESGCRMAEAFARHPQSSRAQLPV